MNDASRDAGTTIVLRPAPFWTPSIFLIALATAGTPLGFVLGRTQAGIQPSFGELLVLILVMLVAISIVAVVRWRTRPRSAPAIVLERDFLRLPVTHHSSRTRDVPYADVLSVDVIGKGMRARMLVNTRRKLFVYPLASFDHVDPATSLRTGVRSALAAQGADRLLQEMDERERLGKQAWLIKPVVTTALIAIISVIFLIELLLGALDRTFALVQYGANASALVWSGQWFRLFSANFLHLNAVHIWMNALALFSLGTLLERLAGRWRFTCIYLLSASGGALASAFFAQAAFSVGASTAIYGLLGSLAVLEFKYRVQLPSGFRQTNGWWIYIVTLNVVLAALLPVIDIGAHVGGALAGAATTLLLYRGVGAIDVESRPRPALRVVTCGIVVVFGAALFLAVSHSRTGNADEDALAVARGFVNSPATKPAALNSYAWGTYVDAKASDAELDLALQAVRSAIKRDNDVEYWDTQSALLFRTGQDDEAVRSELRAISMLDKEYFWWQLTRFLAHRVNEKGPLSPLAMETPEISISEAESSHDLELRGTHGCAAGCTIYLLVKQAGAVAGILQLPVGADAQVHVNLAQIAGASEFPRLASLELALVEAGECGACQGSSIRGRYVPLKE